MIAVKRLLRPRNYLTFALGDREYGFSVQFVSGIIPLLPVEPLPGAPQYCRGVTKVGGKAVTIVSTRMKLGMMEGKDQLWTSIILTDLAENLCVGWVVDRALDVLDIEGFEIEQPPPAFREGNGVFGFVKRGKRATILLDAGDLLGTSHVIS